MKREQKQMVELEEFEQVCRERNALQKENKDLWNQNGLRSKKIDELRKRCQEAEERAVGFQTHLTTQEEVIERLKAQNVRFVEEQREAKQRAASLAADNARAREEVARLVRLADAFKAQNDHLAARLAKVTQEKNQIQAEYDARGKVIKKLRKRLHKLKKKLKH